MCKKAESLLPLIAVTNRHLYQEDAAVHILGILKDPTVSQVILREKDLTSLEYKKLSEQILSNSISSDSIGSDSISSESSSCREKLILHTYWREALELGITKIHLPFSLFLEVHDQLQGFDLVGTSVHSLADARLAERYGADYVTAGHIFDTKCKPDLPGRGLSFLTEITHELTIPVYAIGGIHPSNQSQIYGTGAAGICMMSEFA